MSHPVNPAFVERLRLTADRVGTRREAAEICGVSLDAVVRYLRGENQPGFLTMSRLCEAASVSMRWLATGEGLPELHAANQQASSQGIPVAGMAESKESGWYTPQSSTMQTSLDLPDPKAFATVVHGQNLVPEGLHPGFLCVCSPMLRPVKGDIIHLKRHDGLCALRVFLGEEGDWLLLKGYTDQDAKGSQRSFEDKVKRSTITEIAPVVFVRRKV